MLDIDALAHPLAADRSCDLLAQALLQMLVFADVDGAAAAWSRRGADRPRRTRATGVGGKLDDGAELEALDLPHRAGNRPRPHIELEIRFGKESGVLVAA